MLLKYRRLGFGVLVGFLLFARSSSRLVSAQQSPCDPNLTQLGQNPQGYRLRGDRCEGIYIQPVSGSTTLLVASFTEFFEDFDPSLSGQLSASSGVRSRRGSGWKLRMLWITLGYCSLGATPTFQYSTAC
jgi:hypothetical protein